MDSKRRTKNLALAVRFACRLCLLAFVAMLPFLLAKHLLPSPLAAAGISEKSLVYLSNLVFYLLFLLLYPRRTQFKAQLREATRWKGRGLWIAGAFALGVLWSAAKYSVACNLSESHTIYLWAEYDSLGEFFAKRVHPEPVLGFVLVLLLGPVFEELVCRFHLTQHFGSAFSRPVTVLLTSLVFAALHLDSTVTGFWLHFVSGVFYYLICSRSGSLLCAIAAHIGGNFFLRLLRYVRISDAITSIPGTLLLSALAIAVYTYLIWRPADDAPAKESRWKRWGVRVFPVLAAAAVGTVCLVSYMTHRQATTPEALVSETEATEEPRPVMVIPETLGSMVLEGETFALPCAAAELPFALPDDENKVLLTSASETYPGMCEYTIIILSASGESNYGFTVLYPEEGDWRDGAVIGLSLMDTGATVRFKGTDFTCGETSMEEVISALGDSYTEGGTILEVRRYDYENGFVSMIFQDGILNHFLLSAQP